IQEAPPHRDIRDVRAPNLVWPVDGQAAQQVLVGPVLGVRDRRARLLIDRRKAHLGHQPPHPHPAHAIAPPAKMPGHLARAVPGRLQERLVDQPHQLQVQRGLARRLVVEGRSAGRHQRALPPNRQPRMVRLDHLSPPVHAQRPKALDKKSRSTTSWPILACSLSISPSRAPSVASALPENTPASPSMACLRQAAIIVWWTPCFVANCDRVSSPFSASSATLALKSAEYRFRFPVIKSVLQRGRTYLSRLSDFPAPPHDVLHAALSSAL